MTQEKILVTVSSQQVQSLQGWNVTPAHLAYRIGRGFRLLRAGGPPPRGGVMVIADQGYDGFGDPGPFCQEVLRECQARGFSGAVLDLEARLPPLARMAARLDDAFSRRGWTLYIPEGYAPAAPQARIMIPSALSGGSLARRLEEAKERFGRERVVLALQMTAEDFFLPSPSGSGTPLSWEELARLRQRLNPSVFFSPELCARYFTYMSRDTGAHFVLFDDGDTLRRKVEAARRAGITTFLASWDEIREHTDALGLHRAPSPQRAPR